jgi:hypothetical protein
MDTNISEITLDKPRQKRAKLPLIGETAAALGVAAVDKAVKRAVTITPPKFESAVVTIVGDSPLVIHAFSAKAQNQIRETQEAGSQSQKGKKRAPKDFDEAYNSARYVSQAGWDGFPASAIRSSMISACRTVGFKMTIAKMSLFCIADGYDERGTPLVRITKGEPTCHIGPARNANGGIDLRARPMFAPGWEAKVTLRWDSEQFSASDIVNLLARAGGQVGLCEGRPDSKMSAGCGWGTFVVRD